ncbi:glycoside hydrolase superfamily [Mycena olivaceomarginata]|nr:glycoside hydrolase superfamily [Mycena olivaceomarginata]
MCPNKISAETLTNINLAFTLISLISISFNIVEMTKGDFDLWKRTTALKQRNPTLKVFVCIGGWTFNDPYSLDVDWEYPAADDRGGIANYVTFMAALKKAFAGP